ncbi:NAD(P)/FAD-dependent oxidoreductase [Agrobacterium radiobacter]|uniref:NAD(P)/FAD-dependent oxidoreductase n=1 Tax=Agrobacterium radiobacter TaxID=362 RepID=A0ABD5LQH4_AGRRD
MSSEAGNAKRVLVVGGGVAGLEIATQLGRSARRKRQIEVTLLDADSAHIWKPMLHTIAAGTRDVYQQQVAYAAQARNSGFIYQPGAMCGLDRKAREVLVAPILAPDGRLMMQGRRLPYDVLIMALGSQANDFRTPGVFEHCYMIDSRAQADNFNQELRIRMLQSMEEQSRLAISIVGGGATGVELAAELVHLAQTADLYGGAGMSSRLKVCLIESGDRLLASFPADISQSVKSRLEELGVTVLTGSTVGAAEENGFRLSDGELIESSLMIWAAGVKAPDFLHELDGLETARNNQLVVLPSLQTTRDPAIFAVGDCASFTPAGEQRPLPPTAQVAHQQARHVISHLPTWLNGTPVPGYAYQNFGALVSLAQYDAFGSLGKFGFLEGRSIRGHLAQLSHAMLYRAHQSRIHGFWNGSLVWLVDRLNARLRARIRLD